MRQNLLLACFRDPNPLQRCLVTQLFYDHLRLHHCRRHLQCWRLALQVCSVCEKESSYSSKFIENSRTFRRHHGLSGPRLFTRTDKNKSPYVCGMVHKRSIRTYMPYRDIIKPTLCEGFALYSGLDGISLKSSTDLFLELYKDNPQQNHVHLNGARLTCAASCKHIWLTIFGKIVSSKNRLIAEIV